MYEVLTFPLEHFSLKMISLPYKLVLLMMYDIMVVVMECLYYHILGVRQLHSEQSEQSLLCF